MTDIDLHVRALLCLVLSKLSDGWIAGFWLALALVWTVLDLCGERLISWWVRRG